MDKVDILQNLKDAGCDKNFIEEFLSLEEKAQLNLLARHRNSLLDSLHNNQKQIDCLDYLIFNLKQK